MNMCGCTLAPTLIKTPVQRENKYEMFQITTTNGVITIFFPLGSFYWKYVYKIKPCDTCGKESKLFLKNVYKKNTIYW